MYHKVSPKVFHKALSEACDKNTLIRDNVTLQDDSVYWFYQCFLYGDKRSGFAITNGGELVSLFSLEKGRGEAMVSLAVVNGGRAIELL